MHSLSKTLVIAEKPSVGRDIARVLNAKQKGAGFLYSDTHIVSWAVGHLVTLFEPEDYNRELKKWQFDSLPIIPAEIKLKGIKATKDQLYVLKNLMNADDVTDIICATDSGREGELIFRYIYSIVKCKKPVKRLWISSMTDAAIENGFKNLKPARDYDGLYKSAQCRSQADWLVGINATRAYTVRYNELLSIGRVQTPTLAIITERQMEIDAFVPEDYWTVKADFETNDKLRYNGIWVSAPADDNEESRIFEQAKAKAIIDSVTGKGGKIERIIIEEKKQPPNLLYDLTSLQRDANKIYGFSAKKTLDLAQALYERRKMITYPRTDSRYLPDDMIPKLKGVIERLNIEPYDKYAGYILSLPQLPISKRIADNAKISDHHAIIPTDNKVNLGVLTADEKKVYNLVAIQFLQAFFPYYIYNVTKVYTRVCAEVFLSKGISVVQLGFMQCYNNKPNGEEQVLPDLKQDSAVTVIGCKTEKKKTKPPKAYTEATLLSAMENAGRFVEDEALKEQLKEQGIGTPATRAAIIERLITVGYIERNGKTLAPTQKGMKLIEIVPKELKSPETTGKWERALNQIAKNKMAPAKFMASIHRYVEYIINECRGRIDPPAE